MKKYQASEGNNRKMIDLSESISEAAKSTIHGFIDDKVSPQDGADIIINAYLRSLAMHIVSLEANFGKEQRILDIAKEGLGYWYGNLKQPKTETQVSQEPSS